MNVPMIDQALAAARGLIGAQNGVTPPARAKFTAPNGRTFTKVPAAEWRRLLSEALSRVSLVLLTESEVMSGEVLTVTFTLTHYACGDTRTLTRAEPLPPAPSRSLAKQWAHTRAVNAVARTLLWQWDDEDEDETEGQKPDTRSQSVIQEEARRARNGASRSTRATSRATAALADALVSAPVSVEFGDEEREREAAMDLEAARLAAEPTSLPPVPDPDWLDGAAKALGADEVIPLQSAPVAGGPLDLLAQAHEVGQIRSTAGAAPQTTAAGDDEHGRRVDEAPTS